MNLKTYFLIFAVALFAVGCSTGGKQSHSSSNKADTESVITEAQGIEIERHGSYTIVKVKDPWNEGELLQTYVLVPRNAKMPTGLPEGTVIRTPLIRTVVYSSVHGGVINELGELESIDGVCDAEYFNMPEVTRGLKEGTIANMGSSQSPSVEMIVELAPDAIILSPFQNAGYGVLSNMKIPLIECADYMEATPLGRAEWIKFFGELYGKTAIADSIYNVVATRYNELKDKVADVEKRPKVFSEMLYSGVWYVPGGKSYMACMFNDAGADYPWADDTNSGSLQLDFAQVLEKAGDADYWLIKPMRSMSYKTLGAENSLYKQFKAFKKKHVYQCVTSNTTYFQDFPFHPDVLLADLVAIFHPELAEGYETKYYVPVINE